MFFLGVCVIMIDIGLHHAQRIIEGKHEMQNEIIENREKELEDQLRISIKKKTTGDNYTGFAYAGEAGNDKLVTDKLQSKMTQHFKSKLTELGHKTEINS